MRVRIVEDDRALVRGLSIRLSMGLAVDCEPDGADAASVACQTSHCRSPMPSSFTAPDIAGKGIANPLALLLAVGLMLEHTNQPVLANRLREAIDQVLRKDGVRHAGLGRPRIHQRFHAKHYPSAQSIKRQLKAGE